MKGFAFLILGFTLWLGAFISIYGIVDMAKENRTHYLPEGYQQSSNGLNGGAAGLGIVAASLIVCGSFFLYKAFSDSKK